MTNEQINIAIAQACGWTNVAHNTVFSGRKIARGVFGNSPSGGEYRLTPNYCGDLNDMHEAEMCIPEDKQALYDSHLVAIVGKETGLMPSLQFRCIHASAKQRAKAFLRTVGKWEEGK